MPDIYLKPGQKHWEVTDALIALGGVSGKDYRLAQTWDGVPIIQVTDDFHDVWVQSIGGTAAAVATAPKGTAAEPTPDAAQAAPAPGEPAVADEPAEQPEAPAAPETAEAEPPAESDVDVPAATADETTATDSEPKAEKPAAKKSGGTSAKNASGTTRTRAAKK